VKDDIASSVMKAGPPIGANFWLWLNSHDINWFVAVATLVYIGLQGYVLVRDKVLRRRTEKDDSEVPSA
jgi:hypothetical protein